MVEWTAWVHVIWVATYALSSCASISWQNHTEWEWMSTCWGLHHGISEHVWDISRCLPSPSYAFPPAIVALLLIWRLRKPLICLVLICLWTTAVRLVVRGGKEVSFRWMFPWDSACSHHPAFQAAMKEIGWRWFGWLMEWEAMGTSTASILIIEYEWSLALLYANALLFRLPIDTMGW